MKLSPESRAFLDGLAADVHLQVFVTPTCPYCPPAVILAQQMAFYSPRVRADMIEATEFPQLAQKYNVYGVPRTVINEKEFDRGRGAGSAARRKDQNVTGKIKPPFPPARPRPLRPGMAVDLWSRGV